MLNKVLEFSIRQRLFVLLATFVLVGVGVVSALKLPIDAVPDVTNTQVQVNTTVNALAPEEIEKLVTFPLENELAGVSGMSEMRSISKFGLSQVTLIFADGTDVYRARQLVSERIQNAVESLPRGLTPRLAPISTGLGEIYYYVVDYAKDAKDKPATREAQLMELKQIHDLDIKPRLRATPGIAEVNGSGGFEKQIVVQPDPARLRNAGLSFGDMAAALGENMRNAGGSVIQLGGEQVAVRATGRVQTMEEIANLPLKFAGRAEVLRVKDVATVATGSAIRTGTSTYNGEEAMMGAALMLAGENSRVVAKAVDEKLKEIQTKLPPGVVITPVYDRTVLVDKTIGTVERSLFEGAILVVVVLLLLLGNWRAALIVSLAIPLSLLFAITGMVKGGISGNLMSLGAIDFGLIVDGAVVMVENIIRHMAERQHQLGRRLTPMERAHEVLVSSREVCTPMFFGVLIITVVYVPILSLSGIEGKMFHPMAMTVIFALIGSLVLALTLVPALCSYLLGGDIKEEDAWLVRVTKKLYAPILRFSLTRRWIAIGGAVSLLALAGWTFTRLGAEFVPQLDEGSSAANMIRTTSIGLDASLEMQRQAEKLLKEKFPEVAYTFSRIGTSEVATDPMGVNVADCYIFYTPEDKWRKVDGRTITKDELVKLMSDTLAVNVPGQSNMFSQPIQMRFNEILEGTRADIAVKVFGEDFDEIERIAKEAREILEKVRGTADIELDAVGKAPMLEIVPRREVLARYNMQAEEINRVVEAALAGEETGKLIEGNRRFDIVVRLPESRRVDVEGLKLLPVRAEGGGMLTLGQVADIKLKEQVATVSREFGRRRAAIMINLRGRDVESYALEANAKLAAIKLPPGYTIEFGGQFQNLIDARQRMMVVVPVAMVLIFVLIFFTFRSVRQTVLVFTAVPLAVTGGVFALWLRDLPFSISAAVGFIALSGIAVLNGLMIITFFNQLREQGADLKTAVWDGSLLRLRPKLMTALVASLGFVPMALAHGSGAEVQRPLATVVIGGIITSTFLTLVILPTLYAWVERDKPREILPETDNHPKP
jgi:cobalt-zinc-cadmium resistance protein CzcA